MTRESTGVGVKCEGNSGECRGMQGNPGERMVVGAKCQGTTGE